MRYYKGNWSVRPFGETTDGDPYYFIELNPNDSFNDAGEYLCISGVMNEDTARLIASAPELYKALKKLTKTNEFENLSDKIKTIVFSALNKAETKLKEMKP